MVVFQLKLCQLVGFPINFSCSCFETNWCMPYTTNCT